jgi:hypothetical protein
MLPTTPTAVRPDRVSLPDDAALNLELLARNELQGAGRPLPADHQADIDLFDAWLEPTPPGSVYRPMQEGRQQPDVRLA